MVNTALSNYNVNSIPITEDVEFLNNLGAATINAGDFVSYVYGSRYPEPHTTGATVNTIIGVAKMDATNINNFAGIALVSSAAGKFLHVAKGAVAYTSGTYTTLAVGDNVTFDLNGNLIKSTIGPGIGVVRKITAAYNLGIELNPKGFKQNQIGNSTTRGILTVEALGSSLGNAPLIKLKNDLLNSSGVSSNWLISAGSRSPITQEWERFSISNSRAGLEALGIDSTLVTRLSGGLKVEQSSYCPGLISVSGTSVTGNANTTFLNTFAVGQTITIGTTSETVTAIASNNSMTTTAWPGAVANVSYTTPAANRFQILPNGNIYLGDGATASAALFTDANKNLTNAGPGTTAQYIRGDGSLATLPVTPSLQNVAATGNAYTGQLQSQSLAATGTAGTGYLKLPLQSASPAAAVNNLIIYPDSLNRLSWKNSSYRRTIKVGRNADQTITMPYRLNPIVADSTDAAAAIALKLSKTDTAAMLSPYIRKAAANDTLSGNLKVNGTLNAAGAATVGSLTVPGSGGHSIVINGNSIADPSSSSGFSMGANLVLQEGAGIIVQNGSGNQLIINGNVIQRASDSKNVLFQGDAIDLTGGSTITTSADAVKGLQLKRHSSTQAANMLEVQNESGVAITTINAAGSIGVGGSNTYILAPTVYGTTFQPGVATGTDLIFQLRDNAQKFNFRNAGGTTQASISATGAAAFAHIGGTTPAPTIAAGAGAGTSPTVSVSGNDMIHKISITTGTSPAASATVATITFNTAYSTAPKVILSPAGANSAALTGLTAAYVDDAGTTTTTYTIKVGSGGLAAATTYLFYASTAQ
jgi:hypothetical protein